MTTGHLFEGIGGFMHAAKMVDFNPVFWCEIDPTCQRVLEFYHPGVDAHGDIKTTNFKIYESTIDILSGGFPYQPFSNSGKQLGPNDPRFLWEHMLRAIQEIKPAWIVGENVRGIISNSKGVVFEDIQASLEIAGYQQLPFLLPASAVGAIHERYRTFFVAYSDDARALRARKISEGNEGKESAVVLQEGQERNGTTIQFDRRVDLSWNSRVYSGGMPDQPPVFSRNDGISTRLSGITVSNWLKFCQHGYGNAIHPFVVKNIFQAIKDYENNIIVDPNFAM